MSVIILYATLVVCAVIIGAVVLEYDLYDREPRWLVAIAIAIGALTMYLAGEVQVWASSWLYAPGEFDADAKFAMLAAITEEAGKLLVVAAIALGFRRHFNDPMDGMIFGAFAGLGAALEESVAIFFDGGHRTGLPVQEPIRIVGHLMMGGIGGFGVGLTQIKMGRWRLGVAVSYLAAVTLHFLWDVIAFAAADHAQLHGRQHTVHTLGAIAVMGAGLLMFRAMVRAGARMSKSVFVPEAGRVPAPSGRTM